MYNRFWSKVKKGGSGECWEWQGSLNSGYGQYHIPGTADESILAHRYAYVITHPKGEEFAIPEGYEICHLCDNRRCVNPMHLFVGTRSDNMQDSYLKGKGPKRKLSNEEVLKIRELHATGQYPTYESLAKVFSVSRWAIGLIITGKTFNYLK